MIALSVIDGDAAPSKDIARSRVSWCSARFTAASGGGAERCVGWSGIARIVEKRSAKGKRRPHPALPRRPSP